MSSCSESTTDNTTADSADNIPQFQQIGTDEILFNIRVLNVFESPQNVCGAEKSNVASIEIMEVLEKGSTVRQKVSKEEQFNLVFLFTPSNLEQNVVIEAKARETLCKNSSETYFTVISHKILD